VSRNEELSRTAALGDILDSGPEPCFDRITRLAASVLNVPIAVISLVDGERAVAKSAWGMDVGEMPREFSLGGQSIPVETVAFWGDLSTEMPEHPWVAGAPHLRFYAGARIRWNEIPIGMLSIADVQPRPRGLDERDRQELAGLAALVEDALRLRMTILRADAADEDRREWSEQYSIITAAVSDAILTVDPEGIVRFANRAVETIFGYPPEEIVNQPFAKIFGSEMQERFQRYFITNRRTLDWRGTPLLLEHPSGRKVPVEFSLGEIHDQGRKLAVVVRDRSEQVRIQTTVEARELEFRSLLENIQEVIFRTDLMGRWTFLNPAWTALTGFPVAESLGRTFLEFAPLQDRKDRAEGFGTLLAGDMSVLRREVRYQTASGDTRWAEINARLLFDTAGKTVGTCGTMQDIQQRHVAQHRQEEARKYAESCSAAKNDFLSRASHELRTPLHAILGFAQLLEIQDLPGQQALQVQQILRGGRHMLELLDELIDISRIESGNLLLSIQSVPLFERVSAAVDLIQPLAAERRIDIQVDVSPTHTVMADPKRLTQVLLNLLSNAVKYNREEGAIQVWSEAVPGERRIRLLVRDNGLGLNPRDSAKLFQPFERLGAERSPELSNVSGTGVGLWVTKHLTELMGGAIRVESEPDAGSTFWIELAACAPSGSLETGPAALPPAISAVTVLYIDDSQENLRLVSQILTAHPDVRLITAGNGEGGFNAACEDPPDLILLDLHLPGRTGLELLTRFQANPVTSGIPVLVLTADVTPQTRDSLEEQGVDGWLEKPLDVRRFLDKVKQLVARYVPG
jgi:PAS domain S-box-containing protein